MAFLRVVYLNHGGTCTPSADGVNFADMVTEVLFFKEEPSFQTLEEKVRSCLGRAESSCDLRLSGRYDAGRAYRSYTHMVPIRTEEEWKLYISLVQDSSVMSLVLYAETVSEELTTNYKLDLNNTPRVMEDANNDDSVVGSQPSVETMEGIFGSQQSLDVIDANNCGSQPCVEDEDEPTHQGSTQYFDLNRSIVQLHAGADVTVNVQGDYDGDVDAGDEGSDELDDAVELSGTPAVLPVIELPSAPVEDAVVSNSLDPETFGIRNQESVPYSVAHAEHSDDEGPVVYTRAEATAFLKVYGRKHTLSWFMDMSEADQAVVDGNKSWVCDPEMPVAQTVEDAKKYPRSKPLIHPGLTFKTMVDMKVWMAEYAVRHFRTHVVKKSNRKQRYILKCPKKGCDWVMRARKLRHGDGWQVRSCVVPHSCENACVNGKHRQLTSWFIAHRLCDAIAKTPTQSAATLREYIFEIFAFRVEYGKAWRAKQEALKMVFGDWEEAYGRLPELLQAMQARNPGMLQIVLKHPELIVHRDGKAVPVFGRAFWSFGPSIQAFKHCRPVMAVDGTFLTGKYRGTLLVAIASDANDHLVPLAFALVERENNDTWSWFFNLLRTRIIGPGKTVCVISDRHQGILNAVKIEIPGHPLVIHRWCIRHFAANYFSKARNRDNTDLLREITMIYEPKLFNEKYQELRAASNKAGMKFLDEHYDRRMFWSRAYDEGGVRYGQMTSNMAEIFNRVLKGIRQLPVTAIVVFTFQKCNEYWLKHSDQVAEVLSSEDTQRFPPRVAEKIGREQRKAHYQKGERYDNRPDSYKYCITEIGGTNAGGEQYGGRMFVVEADRMTCTCHYPQLYKLPCSHIITACQIRGIGFDIAVSPLYSLDSWKSTWDYRFHPYLDSPEWPIYDGPRYRPNPTLKVFKRGRRQTKRFKNDMDKMQGKRFKYNDYATESPNKNRCSVCHQTGHINGRKFGCAQRKAAAALAQTAGP